MFPKLFENYAKNFVKNFTHNWINLNKKPLAKLLIHLKFTRILFLNECNKTALPENYR